MRHYLIGAAMLALPGALQAQVTAVVTQATSTIELTPNPSPTIFNFSGTNLAASRNDDFAGGGSFASTSDVDGDEIVFQNGNVSAGVHTQTTSLTILDISFTNGSAVAVQPMLHSSITPAGLGLFVASFCGAQGPVQDCKGASDYGPLAVQLRSQFIGDSTLIARSSFFFDILSDGISVYSIAGSVSLVYDFDAEQNIIVTDLADAAMRLTGFTQVTDLGDAYAIGFAWDATTIDIALAGLLAPGASRVLTYQTGVTTYTRNSSFDGRNVAAYAAFGDPVGRGGSIPPPTFATFGFEAPVFGEDGSLDVTLIGSMVPEPTSWALMLGGFAAAGTALRRQRALAAA